MNPWITVCATVGVGLLAIAANFYNRFVPDVDAQKRHMKLLVLWAWSAASVGVQIYNIYTLAHHGQSVTPAFVVVIAFAVGGLVFTLTMFLLFAFLNSFVRFLKSFLKNLETDRDLSGRMIGIAEKHIAATRMNCEAIQILASEPFVNAEIANRVRALLAQPYTPIE